MNTILVVCSSGLGTSLMIRLHLQSILRKYGVEANVEHTDVASLHTHRPALLIGARQIIETMDFSHHIDVIPLDNIVDRHYIENAVIANKTFREWVDRGEVGTG